MKLKQIWTFVMALMSITLAANNFTTDGNGIRSIVNAKVNDKDVVYISEIDGALSCYTLTGDKLWSQPSQKEALMFKVVPADINGDGNDDIVVASADGHIYAWSSKGDLLWKYAPANKVRFSEVAVINSAKGLQIFAGGNDYVLYEIDTKGNEVSTTKLKGVFRTIESGHFLSEDKESLFVMTYVHDKFRWALMAFIDPDTKAVVKELSYKKLPSKTWSNLMVTDVDVVDVTKNGLDDILFFGTGHKPGVVVGLNSNFEEILKYEASRKERQRYSHLQGKCLLPAKDQIMFQNGGLMSILNLKGELIETGGERYKGVIYNDFAFIAEQNLLLAGGQIGGGNSVYSFNVKKNSWIYKEHKLIGRMAEVEENMSTLYQQALDFTPPSYQKKSDKPWVMVTPHKPAKEVMDKDGAELKMVIQKTLHESSSRETIEAAIGKDALRKDKRGKYVHSRESIVEQARKYEQQKQPFTMWAGHGNDPFYLQIETIEEILAVAPSMCHGFVYAEMHDPHDPRVVYFINEYMPRLATAIRKQGKAKLYFRYKNVFWAATSHQGIWKEMFFSGKYKDILVPASEDTSSRTQDINLVGRVGMYTGGYVDDFAMRLVDDNPTSWRPLSPGGQRSISPYLRQGVMMASYGAQHGVIFSNSYIDPSGMDVLFALMTSGALPQVAPEDIASLSSWMLIKDVDTDLIHDIEDHHNMLQYDLDDQNAVMSSAHMHWAGTDVPDWDISKYLGVEYRWLNYVPELPYGMIAIAPVEYAPKVKTPYTVTDAKQGFVDGKPMPAKEFGKEIEKAAIEGAKQLPIMVTGAAWSAIRLDENHIRLILMDQGYVDPQQREVTITYQNEMPKSAIDILSNETVEISNKTSEVTVPAGSLRFIDVAY